MGLVTFDLPSAACDTTVADAVSGYLAPVIFAGGGCSTAIDMYLIVRIGCTELKHGR
jgi:hypothetical protein